MRIAGKIAAYLGGALAMLATIPAAHAQMAPVATTKILAIGKLAGPPDPARMKQIMPSEVADTVQLYLDGKIDQWFVRKDANGVVFLMNAGSVEEAHALLEKLPLGQSKLMAFELIPLGPLSPLRYLLPAPKAP